MTTNRHFFPSAADSSAPPLGHRVPPAPVPEHPTPEPNEVPKHPKPAPHPRGIWRELHPRVGHREQHVRTRYREGRPQ